MNQIVLVDQSLHHVVLSECTKAFVHHVVEYLHVSLPVRLVVQLVPVLQHALVQLPNRSVNRTRRIALELSCLRERSRHAFAVLRISEHVCLLVDIRSNWSENGSLECSPWVGHIIQGVLPSNLNVIGSRNLRPSISVLRVQNSCLLGLLSQSIRLKRRRSHDCKE